MSHTSRNTHRPRPPPSRSYSGAQTTRIRGRSVRSRSNNNDNDRNDNSNNRTRMWQHNNNIGTFVYHRPLWADTASAATSSSSNAFNRTRPMSASHFNQTLRSNLYTSSAPGPSSSSHNYPHQSTTNKYLLENPAEISSLKGEIVNQKQEIRHLLEQAVATDKQVQRLKHQCKAHHEELIFRKLLVKPTTPKGIIQREQVSREYSKRSQEEIILKQNQAKIRYQQQRMEKLSLLKKQKEESNRARKQKADFRKQQVETARQERISEIQEKNLRTMTQLRQQRLQKRQELEHRRLLADQQLQATLDRKREIEHEREVTKKEAFKMSTARINSARKAVQSAAIQNLNQYKQTNQHRLQEARQLKQERDRTKAISIRKSYEEHRHGMNLPYQQQVKIRQERLAQQRQEREAKLAKARTNRIQRENEKLAKREQDALEIEHQHKPIVQQRIQERLDALKEKKRQFEERLQLVKQTKQSCEKDKIHSLKVEVAKKMKDRQLRSEQARTARLQRYQPQSLRLKQQIANANANRIRIEQEKESIKMSTFLESRAQAEQQVNRTRAERIRAHRLSVEQHSAHRHQIQATVSLKQELSELTKLKETLTQRSKKLARMQKFYGEKNRRILEQTQRLPI